MHFAGCPHGAWVLLALTTAQSRGGSEADVGWNWRVPPNEASGPWRAFFRDRDPQAEGRNRTPGDPGVAALREHLREHGCIRGLRAVSPGRPDYAARAARAFRRDGFVVVEDALSAGHLAALRNATARILERIFEADPEGSFGGGAGKLPHRYSLGDASATKSNLHMPEYCALIDLPTTTPVLQAIFGSSTYQLAGAGGDVVLAGAIEYQSLHMDAIWGPHEGHVQDLPVPPVVTVNFVLEDVTAMNGPMRKVPGSHRWYEPPLTLSDEPSWMKVSTLCPLRAGSAIFRDNRCWHGGTPNLADRARVLPNVEYFAPGGLPSLGWLDRPSMPFERWQSLSPLARYLARGVVAPPGIEIPGMGQYSPGAIIDLMPFMAQ